MVMGCENMKEETIYFFPKVLRKYFCWFPLGCIWMLAVIIAFNFNLFAFLFVILACLMFSFWCYYMNNNKIVILGDKLIYYGVRKQEILYKDIKEIVFLHNDAIKIVCNDRNYSFAGHIDFLASVPNSHKNRDLVEKIKDRMKRKYRG